MLENSRFEDMTLYPSKFQRSSNASVKLIYDLIMPIGDFFTFNQALMVFSLSSVKFFKMDE